MKEYYFIRSGKTIHPIAYRHEDGTTVLFNEKLGRIDFEGTKTGDKIKMFDGQKYEGTCEVLEVWNINNTIQLTLSDPLKEDEEKTNRTMLLNAYRGLKKELDKLQQEKKAIKQSIEHIVDAIIEIEAKAKEINLKLEV